MDALTDKGRAGGLVQHVIWQQQAMTGVDAPLGWLICRDHRHGVGAMDELTADRRAFASFRCGKVAVGAAEGVNAPHHICATSWGYYTSIAPWWESLAVLSVPRGPGHVVLCLLGEIEKLHSVFLHLVLCSNSTPTQPQLLRPARPVDSPALIFCTRSIFLTHKKSHR